MDVIVGRIPQATGAAGKRGDGPAPIEAKVLHIREPRRNRDQNRPLADDQRQKKGRATVDPPGARVLVLLVPDAFRLPDDLSDGPYRIFLRIVRR